MRPRKSVITKRVNPFGPLTGSWRGANTDKLFCYSFYGYTVYQWIEASDVKRLIADNELNYETFKAFHKTYVGTPKKVFSNGRWIYFYSSEIFWDWAFQKGFGEYPFPRVDVDGNLINEDGEVIK